MTFKELSDLIHTSTRTDYATLLLSHSQQIISEVGRTTKKETAVRLKISPQTFSLVYQLILAHTTILEDEEATKSLKA